MSRKKQGTYTKLKYVLIAKSQRQDVITNLVIKHHANLKQQIGELTKHELLPWLLLCFKHTRSHRVYTLLQLQRGNLFQTN
ncbi:hypothetical protein QL285_041296 [Trifolium repens]|nr:hypothetical protein QL285_041296 [Trifolium repens]